jgi:hypothetical protein
MRVRIVRHQLHDIGPVPSYLSGEIRERIERGDDLKLP